jgi:hypothetical protein
MISINSLEMPLKLVPDHALKIEDLDTHMGGDMVVYANALCREAADGQKPEADLSE